MKAAAAAFGAAAAFLAGVLAGLGLGQRQAPQERAPASIEVRQADPVESSPARPTPRSTHSQKVVRSVRDEHLEDHHDNSGSGSDDSGSGSDDSGSGSDDSGPGGHGDSGSSGSGSSGSGSSGGSSDDGS
jgi:hypothetical protein